eukprot:11646974-Ditylum_brightwellii.AAC.1
MASHVRRSTRDMQMTPEAIESLQTQDIVFAAEYYASQDIIENLAKIEMYHPIAFVTKHNPGTMYFHQAIKKSDASHFVKAVYSHGDQ